MDDKNLSSGKKKGADGLDGESARILTSVIGPSVTIRGTIKDAKDSLTIKGKVEGKIDHEKTLLIDQQGTVKAEINARDVLVYGTVVGNIHGTDRVRIEASGRVSGDIYAKRFSVEEGARMKGRVIMSTTSAESILEPLGLEEAQNVAKVPNSAVKKAEDQAASVAADKATPNITKSS